MDFALSAEQLQLQRVARDYFGRHRGMAVARELLEGKHAQLPDLRPELGEMGLLGLLAGEHVGGGGGNLVDLVVVAEEAGKMLSPDPLVSTAAWAVPVLAAAAVHDSAVSGVLLAEVMAGARAIAAAEPDGMHLTHNLLTGTAAAVLDALPATAMLTYLNDSLVLVDLSAEGVRLDPGTPIDPTRGLARISLVDVAVTVLAQDNAHVARAWEAARYAAMTALAAECCGTAAAAMESARQYALHRNAFGRAIGSFQAVKHALVEVYLLVDQVRSLVWLAASTAEHGKDELAPYALGALAFAADAVSKATDTLIHVHGGIGVTWEHDAHLLWRRARTDRLIFGDVTELRSTLVDAVLPAAARSLHR